MGDNNISIEDDDEIDITETIDSETGKKVYNNWTKDNTNTAITWKTSTEYDTYIYKKILYRYKYRLDRIFILITILSMFISILGFFSGALGGSVFFGVDNVIIQYIIFVTGLLSGIIGILVTTITNIVKYFKWDDKVTQISKYITNLDNFNTNVSNQLILPDKARLDASEFLKKENLNFSNLKKNDPDISLTEYQNAGRGYEDYLKNNNEIYKATQEYIDNVAFNMV